MQNTCIYTNKFGWSIMGFPYYVEIMQISAIHVDGVGVETIHTGCKYSCVAKVY